MRSVGIKLLKNKLREYFGLRRNRADHGPGSRRFGPPAPGRSPLVSDGLGSKSGDETAGNLG
jgi:hypothetical protein